MEVIGLVGAEHDSAQTRQPSRAVGETQEAHERIVQITTSGMCGLICCPATLWVQPKADLPDLHDSSESQQKAWFLKDFARISLTHSPCNLANTSHRADV